jgi:hypothetical protein
VEASQSRKRIRSEAVNTVSVADMVDAPAETPTSVGASLRRLNCELSVHGYCRGANVSDMLFLSHIGAVHCDLHPPPKTQRHNKSHASAWDFSS